MDNIGSTNKEYKNIITISVSFFLVVIQAYLMMIFCGIDIFNFNMVENLVLKYILQVIIQLLMFAGLFSVIYFCVKALYCRHWIKNHKNIWVKGLWLHIHLKNEPRIGIVDLKQNFYTISASGRNIYPDGIDKPQRVTTWYYKLGKVNDDREKNADLIGYYRAGKEAGISSKDGIHILNIDNNYRKQLSYSMVGNFRDTVNAEGGPIDEHSGKLYLFRLSNEMLKAVTDEESGRIDDEKLARLHLNSEFQSTNYAKRLRRFIDEYNSRQS